MYVCVCVRVRVGGGWGGQQGVVRSIKPYGAFVDIGGITGLLHISQISHDHITDVTKVLREGQEISAMILTQDKEKGRFSLSTKVPVISPFYSRQHARVHAHTHAQTPVSYRKACTRVVCVSSG